jgi:hypothetical protein
MNNGNNSIDQDKGKEAIADMTPPLKNVSKFSILSFFLGIGGLVTIGHVICLILSAMAIITGHMAIVKIRRKRRSFRGSILAYIRGSIPAYIGFTLGIIAILLCLITIIHYPERGLRSRVSRVRADMRSMDTALENYWNDHNSFPAWASGNKGSNGFLSKKSPAFKIPTFRTWSDEREANTFYTLTTPKAYIQYYPWDHMTKTRGTTFSYFCDHRGWILLSPGPDGDYDVDPKKVYDSTISQPSPELLRLRYDPSNGIISNGDIFRVKY